MVYNLGDFREWAYNMKGYHISNETWMKQTEMSLEDNQKYLKPWESNHNGDDFDQQDGDDEREDSRV